MCRNRNYPKGRMWEAYLEPRSLPINAAHGKHMSEKSACRGGALASRKLTSLLAITALPPATRWLTDTAFPEAVKIDLRAHHHAAARSQHRYNRLTRHAFMVRNGSEDRIQSANPYGVVIRNREALSRWLPRLDDD